MAPAEEKSSDPSERPPDLRLARIHLRSGALALARAELEAMAGQDALDRAGSADLAEARWRMGDLEAAAEAARAHLDGGGEELVAFLIVAEALAAAGRISEARRLGVRVAERAAGRIDALFAGEPRHAMWRDIAPAPPPISPGAPAGEAAASGPLAGTAAGVAQELLAVEIAVVAGDLQSVAVRLALVLRVDRQLAPAVLSLADRALSADEPADRIAAAALHLVRGDACRVLGHESAAAQAFEESRRALGALRTTEEHS